jgi:hypothetical protein
MAPHFGQSFGMADVYIPLTFDPNEYVYIVLRRAIFSMIFKESIMSKIDSGKMISRLIRLSRYFCRPFDGIVGPEKSRGARGQSNASLFDCLDGPLAIR